MSKLFSREEKIKHFFLFAFDIIILIFIVLSSKNSYSYNEYANLNEDSRSCLSCHDGAMAKEISLHDSHPVGVSYPPFEKRQEYNVFINLPLYDGRMQCKTCHDISLNTLCWTTTRITMSGSRLCLECHIK